MCYEMTKIHILIVEKFGKMFLQKEEIKTTNHEPHYLNVHFKVLYNLISDW